MKSFTPSHPPPADVFGPYSLWPRPPRKTRRTLLVASAFVGAAALFVHCVLPMALST